MCRAAQLRLSQNVAAFFIRLLVTCAVFVAAASVSPAKVLPLLTSTSMLAQRGWAYFCSMVIGASPFLAAAAAAAAIASRYLIRVPASGDSTRNIRQFAAPLFVMLFPGCDCTLTAFAPVLRATAPSRAAFAFLWGACCNPIALVATASIFGTQMLAARLCAGALASSLAAWFWRRQHFRSATAPHGSGDTSCSSEMHGFANYLGRGTLLFAGAAIVATTFLIAPATAWRLPQTILTAVLFGAATSPCSGADALLARVLFRSPSCQLAFMIASQCLDVRTLATLRSSFGGRPAMLALLAAAIACVALCLPMELLEHK